jgi:hypothetical protein
MEQESCANCLYKDLGDEDGCETRFWLNSFANTRNDNGKCVLYMNEDYKDELAIGESLEFQD